jgi:sugar/nucleoside kinase (ribokinase family)
VVNLRRAGEPVAVSAALSTGAERTFVTYAGANDRLEDRIAAALPRLRARHVHLAFRPRRPGRWARLVASLRARRVTTSWDFGWHEDLPRAPGFAALLRAVDYVSVNERETLLYGGGRTLEAAARRLAAATRCALIKLGARGARLIGGDGDLDVAVPAPRVSVVDTVGAGDAFNGGFLHARLAGGSPAESLLVGVAVASFSVGAAGGLAGLPRGAPPIGRAAARARRRRA